jgi:uncharacterized membrane protein YidH (DUF202 family)
MKTEKLPVIDYDALSSEELSEISRNDHQEDTHQYDKQQNALCLVVIGAMCLVCAALFFILSFKRVMNKSGILDTSCLPFYICIGCLIAAVILLGIGLFLFFKAFVKRKKLKEEIATVTLLKKQKFGH